MSSSAHISIHAPSSVCVENAAVAPRACLAYGLLLPLGQSSFSTPAPGLCEIEGPGPWSPSCLKNRPVPTGYREPRGSQNLAGRIASNGKTYFLRLFLMACLSGFRPQYFSLSPHPTPLVSLWACQRMGSSPSGWCSG